MSQVYSTLLLSSHDGAGGTIDAAEGTRVVIRDVSAFNANPVGGGGAEMVLNSSGATIYQRDLSEQEWLNDELRVVINEGDTVTVIASPYVDVTVSGYVLTLP